jgi:hypothetical protein
MAEKITSYSLGGRVMSYMLRTERGALNGYVHTVDGTVSVAAYKTDRAGGAVAYFGTTRNGRVYYTERQRRTGQFTERGLARIASTFAREVARQAGRKHAD